MNDIISWDFVLDRNSEAQPQCTFRATKEFITQSDLNDKTLFAKFEDTNSCYDNKIFKVAADESSVSAEGCNIANACTTNFSEREVLWTLTLLETPYDKKAKGGKFTIVCENGQSMQQYIETKGGDEDPAEPESGDFDHSGDDQTAEEPDSGLGALPLTLIGGLGVSAIALLLVYTLRKKN